MFRRQKSFYSSIMQKMLESEEGQQCLKNLKFGKKYLSQRLCYLIVVQANV
jgi:hypothetical protein